MFYFSKTISKMIYAIYKWELIFSIHIFFFCPKYVYESEEKKKFAQTFNLQNKICNKNH